MMNIHLIVCGTKPGVGRGGISTALIGFFYAFQRAGICFDFVITHDDSVRFGKWRFWLTAFLKIASKIRRAQSNRKVPVVYVHIGGGPVSRLRKATLSVFARFLGSYVIYHEHAPEIVNFYLKSKWWRRYFFVSLLPAHSVAVLTCWWRDVLVNAGIRKPVFVVPNPLDACLEKIASTPVNRPMEKDYLIVLAMSRIERGKGLDLLIEAVPFLPHFLRVVIAGDGSQLPKLKKRVIELGIEQRIRFLGWVGREEKLCLLKEADIFCLPSSWDSFGMGFIEAMAHGLPIVALDWGPISDVVPNGECGILIKQASPKALAKAIIKLAHDANLRKTMGENGRQWVIKQFTAEKVGKKLLVLLENTCTA